MRFRLTCGVGAAALSGALLLLASASPTASASPSPAASSAAATGKLISGAIVGTDGSPAADATVSLNAWPTPQFLAAQAIGDKVPVKAITTTTTSRSGRYSLDPDLSSLGPDYVSPDGSVSLEIDTAQGDASQEWSIPAAIPRSRAAEASADSIVAGSRPGVLDFDLHRGTLAQRVGAAPVHTQKLAATRNPVSSDHVAPMDNTAPGCFGWTSYKSFPDRSEAFLNLYTYSGHATVNEKIGSSHSLGVSANYAGQGWALHGSLSLEKQSSTSGTDSFTGNTRLWNEVNARECDDYCWDSGHTDPHYNFQMRPVSFHMFLTRRDPIAARFWNTLYCDSEYSGTYGKTQGSNQAFSLGLKLPYLSVEARAAFSHETTVSWSPGSVGEFLCGSNSLGFASAPFAGGEPVPSGGGGCGIQPYNSESTSLRPESTPC